MSEFSKISLLNTIFDAVEKYRDDFQEYTTPQDPLGEKRRFPRVKASIPGYSTPRERPTMSAHHIDHLNSDNKVQSIARLLNTYQRKDELTNSWEALSDFDEYRRSSEEDITGYVSNFETKYQQLVMRGITLPSDVLALKLLNRAMLSKQKRVLITENIDFTRKDKLYNEAKQALVRLGEYQEFIKGLQVIRHGKGGGEQNESENFYLVLDSACSSTLCGRKWLDRYLEYLGEELKSKVVYAPGKKSFVFGGGEPVKSTACCRIPAVLAGQMVIIEADVVPNDLPLIYSLGDMKKARIRLDFTNDTAEIFGRKIDLKITETGHYSVPIDGITSWKRKIVS